ncbi:DUF3772 domain-containing protein [Shimia sp.]|uniref:DUF3772 domain-containing protein n=1 Tax=Shimia sp. TaxID=1954381 RepID=UPI003563D0D9
MSFLRCLLLLGLLLLVPGPFGAWAQGAAPDYDQWRRVATRAEEAIGAGRASEAAMDALRKQLVTWRGQFVEAQSQARISIDSLKTRLERLGPEPEPPASEPEDISRLRRELNETLAQTRSPIVKAEIAQAEVDKLIEGLDKMLRERQTSALLQRGASPLNPGHWLAGLYDLRRSLTHLGTEIGTAWAYERRAEGFAQNLARSGALVALALVLLLRGGTWTGRLLAAVQRDAMSPVRWLVAFCLSLGYVLLPLAGVYLLVEAAYATDLAGLRGDRILSALPFAAFLLLMPIWIGRRVFSAPPAIAGSAGLAPSDQARGLGASVLVGLTLASHHLVDTIARFDNWAPEARAVVVFPLILAGAVLMLLFARLFHRHAKAHAAQDGNEARYYDQIQTLFMRLYQLAAVAGVLLALLGYTRASEALVFPAIYTLQVVAFLTLLHRLYATLFVAASGEQPERDAALWPLGLSFVSVLAAVPLFLVIWGMRPQEIGQLYAQFLAGFRVGEITVSPTQIIVFVAVFVIGYALTRMTQSFLRNTFLPRTRLDIGGQNAVASGVGYVGITVAAMVALNNTGIDLGSIALVASALSIGIGFGLQTIVSNFVSGIILLIERPIAEGDWIEVNGQTGYVRDISVRSTRIETFDRTDVIVPNSDLVAGTVVNFTRGNTVGRVIVPVGVAYGTDPRLVERILLEVANAHPMVLAHPGPNVVFRGFGASSLDFEIRAILRDVNFVMSVRSEMNYDIVARFAEAGIEMPFPQQDVWLRNPETLRPIGQPAADGEE